MSDYDRNVAARYGSVTRSEAAIDQGLRSYMLRVYNYMTLGLAITGAAAIGIFMLSVTKDPAQAVATLRNGAMLTQFGATLFASPLQYVVMFAPLAAVLFLSFRVDRMSVSAAQGLFWVYAGLVGVSLSTIFMAYTGESIMRVFFMTAATFGALSLWGYTTKRDLSAMGTFLFMGLIGILIASLVNMFIGSSMLQWIVSVVGVVVFAGLTAYDTQRIKEMYFEGDGEVVAGRKAIMGALTLYLDFINLFVMLLQLFGNRNSN
ncbi:membrane protein [Azorhizobium oxalatiphilum]|uniref:Membrane protein n=1 Tax=Azorhizobium oxalatiphilum TaxID=980631 RepID=A0A917FID0_9HYPH|nr:Bax inhibitor-1/YccA family protein [Azorhizobium oxalatiphilum]GGF85301.1 membrane protein [Azorhizobium oxalatiphilum]